MRRLLVTRSDVQARHVKVRDQRKTIPFTISGKEAVVAQVSYKKRKIPYRCW